MLNSFNKFVDALEASVNVPTANPPNRTASFSASSPPKARLPSNASSVSLDEASPSQLAEQGLSALRRSFAKGAQQATRVGRNSFDLVKQSSYNLNASPRSSLDQDRPGSPARSYFPPLGTPLRIDTQPAHTPASSVHSEPERTADGRPVPQLAILPPLSVVVSDPTRDEKLAFFRAVNIALPGDHLEEAETPPADGDKQFEFPQTAEPEAMGDSAGLGLVVEGQGNDSSELLPLVQNGTAEAGPEQPAQVEAPTVLNPIQATMEERPPLSTIHEDSSSRHARSNSLPPLVPITIKQHAQKPSLGRLPSSANFLLMSPTTPQTPGSEANRLRSQLDGLRVVLTQQNERMRELRDTHQLEIGSMQDELASHKSRQQKHDSERAALKAVADEETEKRSKSISLLKAIRQKLMQAESTKAEIEKSLIQEREHSRQDRNRWEAELTTARSEREVTINKLRTAFDRETGLMRSNFEAEMAARRGQADLDNMAVRANHTRDLQTRDTRIRELERRLREVEDERNATHEDAQLRAAELDSARTWTATLESRAEEQSLDMQGLQQKFERLQEDLAIASRQQKSTAGADDIDKVRADTHRHLSGQYEGRIQTLEKQLRQAESEREAIKHEMTQNMELRLNEVERMRSEISRRDREYEEHSQDADVRRQRLDAAEDKAKMLEERAEGFEGVLEASRQEAARAISRQEAIREDLKDRDHRITELERRIAEVLERELQVKVSNKTLREELRKVSTSVLRAEKSRNPGVGYFAKTNTSPQTNGSSPEATPMSPPASIQDGILSQASIAVSETKSKAEQEAINFEYIRNVILQFVEHREMRAHLVSVLGVILHFTPQEIRRLTAKVNT